MKGFKGIILDGRKDNGSKVVKLPSLKTLLFEGFFRKLVPKRNQFVAVDIGSREIKVVEVSTANGGPRVTAFGRFPAPKNATSDPVGEEALINALNEVFLTSGIQLKEVITTIGGDRVIIRHIKVPVMPGKELEAAVKFEAERIIPIPVDELTIRYLNLGEIESGGEKYLHLLLVAVPTSFVYDYLGIFERAGLSVAAIDLQSLGLLRVFSDLKVSSVLEGTVGVLDIGASTTQLLVVRRSVPQFIRTLPEGGNLLTRSLAKHYGYEFEEAQQMKEETGELFSTKEAMAAAVPNAIQMDISLREGLSGLVREIRRSINYYAAQENATTIGKFIISGGTSKLKGFREFFAGAVGVPVEFGSPGVPGLPCDNTPAAPFDPAFAVVLGTALGGYL